MSHAYVVGVNDQQPGVARKAKFLGERLGNALCMTIQGRARETAQEQYRDAISMH
jgi:hypothetical protein